jgi:hypothetical protein
VRVQRAMAQAALLWSVLGWRVVGWARSYGIEDLFNSPVTIPHQPSARPPSGNEAAKSAGTVGSAQRRSERASVRLAQRHNIFAGTFSKCVLNGALDHRSLSGRVMPEMLAFGFRLKSSETGGIVNLPPDRSAAPFP